MDISTDVSQLGKESGGLPLSSYFLPLLLMSYLTFLMSSLILVCVTESRHRQKPPMNGHVSHETDPTKLINNLWPPFSLFSGNKGLQIRLK